MTENHDTDPSVVLESLQQVRKRIGEIIRGQADVIDLMLTTLLAAMQMKFIGARCENGGAQNIRRHKVWRKLHALKAA